MAVLPSLDTTYPALILKASRGIIHHGAVGIARTLGRLGVPVYAVVEDAFTPLACSRYLTKAFVWESWPGDGEAFLNAMSIIAEIIGHRAILIPMDDLSAVCVAENADALSRWFLSPQLPFDLPRQLANKASLFSLCTRIGIPCARTVAPRSEDDIREFIKHTTFPIVVKAAEQWRLLNDRYSTIVMPTREDLFDLYEHTNSGERSRIIIQEYVPGEDWINHGYCNFDMHLYLDFTGKKMLSYPLNAGSTALGMSIHNEELRCQSQIFLKAVSYSGIFDIDWRLDERDGQYKIVDCNPRVGQNFRMFENRAAIDVVRAQHLNLTGRRIDNAQMTEDRLFTVESFYLFSSLHSGRLYRRPLADSKELAWWSTDDPIPFFLMSLRLLLRAINRIVRRMWNYAIQSV